MATAVNRHILAQTDIELQVDFAAGVTANYWEAEEVLFSYGQLNSLQAFPLNSLISTIQAQINNSNVTVATRDVMAALLKMYNYEELARYNSLTPSLIDSFYQNYTDGLGTNNNVMGNYSVGGFTKEYQPRGCFPVKLFRTAADGGAAIPGLTIKASAATEGIPASEGSPEVPANTSGTAPFSSFVIRFTTTEPLLFLSPFISGLSKNHASFLGLNTHLTSLSILEMQLVLCPMLPWEHTMV